MVGDPEHARDGAGLEGVGPGTICRLLAHPVRRACLREFVDGEGTADLGALADRIRRELPDSESDPEQLRIALAHVHLPALEVNGLISWNREANRITYRESERVEAMLALLEEWDE